MKRLIGIEIGSYTFDASAQTVTLSGIGTISLEQILVISNATDSTLIYNFADPSKSGTFVPATGVLTLEYNTTAMDDADKLLIYVDLDSNGYDTSLDANKTSEQSPIWSRNTDAEAMIVSAQTLTTSFADIGPEIACDGYAWLCVWVKATLQQATNIQLRALAKHTFGGSEEYSFPLNTITSTKVIVDSEVFQYPNTSGILFITKIPLDNCIPYIQLQVKMETDGGTDATIDTLYITKGY